MKSKLEIYALAVCFAAMVCLVISSGIAGYALVTISAPELTINSYKYDNYQTNDDYWKRNECCEVDSKTKKTRPPEEELTKQRLNAFAIEINGEKRSGIQSLIHSSIFIFIGAITLLIHWLIAKNSRTKNA